MAALSSKGRARRPFNMCFYLRKRSGLVLQPHYSTRFSPSAHHPSTHATRLSASSLPHLPLQANDEPNGSIKPELRRTAHGIAERSDVILAQRKPWMRTPGPSSAVDPLRWTCHPHPRGLGGRWAGEARAGVLQFSSCREVPPSSSFPFGLFYPRARKHILIVLGVLLHVHDTNMLSNSLLRSCSSHRVRRHPEEHVSCKEG